MQQSKVETQEAEELDGLTALSQFVWSLRLDDVKAITLTTDDVNGKLESFFNIFGVKIRIEENELDL